MLCAVLLPLLFTLVLELALQAAAEGDDQGPGVVTVHPLLDFPQPGKNQQPQKKQLEDLINMKVFVIGWRMHIHESS